MIKGKGIKGAVGTSASFEEMLKGTGMTVEEHEEQIMEKLGIEAAAITDQTYPRKFLFLSETVLANISLSLHHFALDLQLLQSSAIAEIAEPRRKKQVGSSAMPFKQNPINAENIDSLTEELPGPLFSAWMTGAFVTLERTLRDSAGKRSWLPESFLIIDEALTRAGKVIRGLVGHENAITANLARFAPFSASEIVLTQLTKSGMDRNLAYEIIRAHAEMAVDATRSGLPNPMQELLSNDEQIIGILGRTKVDDAFTQIYHHVGNAPQLCIDFLQNELYPAIRA
jgi:adenylosuccinate lyase